MPDYAKALKVLEERAGALRQQLSALADELDAVGIAQKLISNAIENVPKSARPATTVVLPPHDPTRKPN